MRSNNIKRSMALLIILVAMSSLFLFSVSAATGDLEGLGVTYSGDGTYSHTAGTNTATLSIRASSFWGESKSDTYTFKNPDTASNSVKVSFSYTYSSDSGKTLGKSDNITEKDGVCTITLAPGASFFFTLSSSNNFMQGAQDTSLIISGLTIEPVFDQANVTVQYDSSLGRVNIGTADGTAVSNEEVIVSTKDAPKKLVATTTTAGSQFIAWVDPTNNNKVLSTDPSYSAVPTANEMTVKAIFATTTPWFFVNNKGNVAEGLTAAAAYSGNIILANNATLSSGNYTIPSGTTVVIPFDNSNNVYTTTPSYKETTLVNPSVFRTLTVPDNTTITVEGAMSIGATQSAPGAGNTGNVTGKYGQVKLTGSNSQIIVKGSLYCHGYITGSGIVHAQSGASVYELFQIRDWRGGQATLSWYMGSYKSFVVNEYYVQNIETRYRIDSGALSYVSAAMTMSGVGTQQTSAVYIGSGGLFQLDDGSFVIREYRPSVDRIYYDLYGNVTTAGLNLEVSGYKLNTEKYILSVQHGMTITVKGKDLNGNDLASSANITKAFKFLPGAELIVEENSSLTIDSKTSIYLYDKSDWPSSYIYTGGGAVPAVQSVLYTPSTRGTRAALGSAKLQVDGTLTAYSNIYTTQNGGTSEDKVLTGTGTFINNKSVSGYSKMTLDEMNNNSSKVTVTNNAVVGILAGVSTSKTDVNDSFGTYTYKGRIDTCTFNGSTLENVNFWYINSKETQPTCADGYTDYYCTDANNAYRVYDVGSGSGNHSWTAATCTTPKTCSVCGATEGNALGHSYDDGVITTAPTCEAAGVKTFTCHCGDSYTEEVAATGHTEEIDAAVAATCTETGLTEGKHCSVCNVITGEQTIVSALGHKDENNDHTCDRAGCGLSCCYDGNDDLKCDYTGCGAKLAKLYSIDVAADAKAELTITLKLHDALKSNYKVTFNNEDVPAKYIQVTDDNYLIITQPVASAEMVKDVTVTFTGDDFGIIASGINRTSLSRSVVDYARLVLQQTDPQYDAAKKLVTAMVTYGGYAQLHFASQENYEDVTADYLAYDVLKEVGIQLPDISEVTISDKMTIPEAFSSVLQDVSLGAAISQKVIFELADGYTFKTNADGKVELTLTHKKSFRGEETTTTLIATPETTEEGATRYVVNINNIPAAFLNYSYQISGTVIKDGEEKPFKITPSVTAYLGRILTAYNAKNVPATVTDELANLAKAMYRYNQEANDFFSQVTTPAEMEVNE